MHEELNKFIKNNVWEWVPCPDNHNIIEAKRIIKNKSKEHETIIRN
jgi:hypothetical protein